MNTTTIHIRNAGSIAICALVALFAAATPASAEEPAPADKTTSVPAITPAPQTAGKKYASTVEGAIERYFSVDSDDPAVVALRKANIEFKRLLVAEMLPSGNHVLVEVELACKNISLRYPLKLEGTSATSAPRWRVTWAPEAAYARTLAEMIRGEKFAKTRAGRKWSEIYRLPAFPIIVSPEFLVSPFGKITPDTESSSASAGGLYVPEELLEQVQRWTGLTLEDDPATANVDLILMAGVSWKRVNQALLPPAMQGLFRIYLVGRGAKGIVGFSAAAPVFKRIISSPSTVVIAMSFAQERGKGEGENAASAQYAFRIRIGEHLLEPSEILASSEKSPLKDGACAPGATFCASTIDEFKEKLSARIRDATARHKTDVAQVMLAATGDLPAATVVRFLGSVGGALELSTGKIFMGYIAP